MCSAVVATLAGLTAADQQRDSFSPLEDMVLAHATPCVKCLHVKPYLC